MEAHQLPSGTYLEQNKYYIDRVLGDGGFGITYLGYDMKLERKVAIKEFYLRGYCYRNPGDTNIYTYADHRGATFEKMKQQYIQEGRVLAVLGEQPGVVNIYTFIEENNTAYLVMDYVEGQSLETYVKNKGGKLSVSETLSIMRPVIRALAGVHKRGVVHRDISPDNIMITYDNKVKLIDFGAARQYGDYNSNKVQKGGYSPIEQVTPQGQVGPYSDIYALCATIYTCITGTRVMRAVERAKADFLVPPSAMGIAIAPQTETTILQGLAVDPAQRIVNAEALYKALYENQTQNRQTTVTSLAVSRMLMDMQTDQKKKMRINRSAWIVCGIVLLLLAVGGGVFLRAKKGSRAIEDTEITTTEVVGADEEVDFEAYAQEFYDLCAKNHEVLGNPLSQREEFTNAAAYTAKESMSLTYANSEELNAGLSEIGNRAMELYKLPNTGWVAYTFSVKEDVENVKKTLDAYIDQINAQSQGTIDLDNCKYLGVSVSRARDGMYFWAVFYQ